MINQYQSFSDVISNWPGGVKGFAMDAGIRPKLASSWKHRDIIPANVWIAIIDKATSKGFIGVTLETLAMMAKNKGKAPPSQS